MTEKIDLLIFFSRFCFWLKKINEEKKNYDKLVLEPRLMFVHVYVIDIVCFCEYKKIESIAGQNEYRTMQSKWRHLFSVAKEINKNCCKQKRKHENLFVNRFSWQPRKQNKTTTREIVSCSAFFCNLFRVRDRVETKEKRKVKNHIVICTISEKKDFKWSARRV